MVGVVSTPGPAVPQQLSDGSPDGTILGQNPSDPVGFFGATPVVQAASGTGAYGPVPLTAPTNTSPYGFSTAAQASQLIALVNAMRASLVNLGLIPAS